MATLTTKYSVGDTVYQAGVITQSKKHPCPDCSGSGKWKAFSPAGGEYTFACPRCSARYNSERDLTLDYSAYVPSVKRLTIGSIQINTAKGSYDEGARYMCVETGIGSGSVYKEDDLFETEDEALRESEARANASNASVEWVVKQYNKSLDISDYQLENAALKLASAQTSNARSMLYNLGYLFDEIEKASDKDKILQAVESYKNDDWESDKRASTPTAPVEGV